MSKNTSVLETVRRLVARAEHPNTPPAEAQLALRQANRMMVRHAIDEAELRAKQTGAERSKPVTETWEWMSKWTEYHPYLRSMLEAIARYNRVMVVISADLRKPEVTVIGMADDASWVQMLYTQCYLAFMTKLAPEWDKSLSIDENVYRLKVSGKSWNEIWFLMATRGFDVPESDVRWKRAAQGWSHRGVCVGTWGGHHLPCGPEHPSNRYLFRAYKRHAKAVGDDNPVETQRHDAYRRSFAKGFAEEIGHRLYQMWVDSEQEVATTGSEVALRDSFEDVKAAFYEAYPDAHPDRVKERAMEAQERSREYWRKEHERRQAMLAAMTDRQRAMFLEREERAAARDQERWARYDQERAHRETDHSGRRLGAAAARDVNLVRSSSVRSETAHAGKLES